MIYPEKKYAKLYVGERFKPVVCHTAVLKINKIGIIYSNEE